MLLYCLQGHLIRMLYPWRLTITWPMKTWQESGVRAGAGGGEGRGQTLRQKLIPLIFLVSMWWCQSETKMWCYGRMGGCHLQILSQLSHCPIIKRSCYQDTRVTPAADCCSVQVCIPYIPRNTNKLDMFDNVLQYFIFYTRLFWALYNIVKLLLYIPIPSNPTLSLELYQRPGCAEVSGPGCIMQAQWIRMTISISTFSVQMLKTAGQPGDQGTGGHGSSSTGPR